MINVKTQSQRKFRLVAVACARWETPYILEWIKYHQRAGFEHIFLYCNDDDASEMAGIVRPFCEGNNPLLTFVHYIGQGRQISMYNHFLHNYAEKCMWFGFFDIDEFVVVKEHFSVLKFLDRFDDNVSSVVFNWIFFGPNGHKTPPAVPVVEAYTRRRKHLDTNTKFLIRVRDADLFSEDKTCSRLPFWHCPMAILRPGSKIVNVIGEDVSEYFSSWPESAQNFLQDERRCKQILSTAVVHHYAFRSERAFHDRVARGLGGSFSGQLRWKEVAEGEGFQRYLDVLNEVEDRTLADFWARYDAPDQTSNEAARAAGLLANQQRCLSRCKQAAQSSISRWSRVADRGLDAAGALNGVIDGGYKFHTDLEDGPWWMVDLGEPSGVSEIRIFNRMDQQGVAERASRLAIDVGFEVGHLVEVCRRASPEPFGGADGHPLIFRPSIPIPGRFVRIRLLTRNYLHLDQVEVYGKPLPEALRKAVDTAA